jgi:hypothetical protein
MRFIQPYIGHYRRVFDTPANKLQASHASYTLDCQTVKKPDEFVYNWTYLIFPKSLVICNF